MGRKYKPLGSMVGRRTGYNSFAAPEKWEIYFPPDAVVNPVTGGTYILEPSGPEDTLQSWTGVFFRWRGPFIIQEFFQGWPALWMGNGYRPVAGEPTDPAWCIFAGYEQIGLGWRFALGKWYLESALLAPPKPPVGPMQSFDGYGDMTAEALPWPT